MITTLSQLVALIESGNDRRAIRFEPNWGNTWYRPDDGAKCIAAHKPLYMNDATAKNICSMSFGAYQIMGSNLYQNGYRGTIAEYLNDDVAQLETFNRYCAGRRILFSLNDVIHSLELRQRFALKYNGSLEYADKICKVAIEHGLLTKDSA